MRAVLERLPTRPAAASPISCRIAGSRPCRPKHCIRRQDRFADACGSSGIFCRTTTAQRSRGPMGVYRHFLRLQL